MEREILEQLYRSYHRELFLYLYSLCRNKSAAEDLLQETFLKAILSLPEAHANIRAWLYLVARNLCFNYLQKEKKTTSLEKWEGVLEDEEDVLQKCIVNEEHRNLYIALSKLERRKREVLEMQYFGGLSQKEIAAILHLTPENVRVLSFRARREMKRELKEEER